MAVCFELGKVEADLPQDWTVQDLYRWHGFLRLKNQAEKRAFDRARQRGGGAQSGINGGVETIVE